jgi:kynurenine formamidase
VQLDSSSCRSLPLGYFAPEASAFGGRPPPKHSVIPVIPCCFEDSIDFNTQSASQWDGFRHFGLPPKYKEGPCIYYNNWTAEDIKSSNEIGTDGEWARPATAIEMLRERTAWMRAGGIVSRGVLIDFYRWAESNGEQVEPNGGRSISLDDIQAILKSQGTRVQPGDILIFRTGWLKWYSGEDPYLRHSYMCDRQAPGTHAFIGVEASRQLVQWLWESQIAAVAGDQVAFESTPFNGNGFGSLHEHLLGAIGCPIGELWDTEALATACESRQSWTFLLTASPLHVLGGVASPANAIALL